METQNIKKNRQWHPAVFAGLQIELEEYADNLVFESEHQLGTKLKEMDFLIIKRDTSKPILKNLGKIFRKHNIFEYKGPEDYLSIDDFYKVYGYICFYKSDAPIQNSIKSHDLTISFLCHKMPQKLSKHLKKHRKYTIAHREKGFYDIYGDEFPMQLILTSQLDKNKNLWLRSLINPLQDSGEVEQLLTEFEKHKKNCLYQSVIDMIMQGNAEFFKGGKENMGEIYDNYMKKVQKKLYEEGLTEGIMCMIKDNLNEGTSKEKICAKLQEYFDLSLESAMSYIEECIAVKNEN